MERTGSLAVEAEVLRERLSDAELEPLRDEVADGPRVAREITGCEALVGAVEEGEVFPLTHRGCDLFPLVLRRVYAGWIVGACVEEDDRAFGGGLDGRQHAIDIEALGLGGEIRVGGCLEADVCEDLLVVGPCWV